MPLKNPHDLYNLDAIRALDPNRSDLHLEPGYDARVAEIVSSLLDRPEIRLDAEMLWHDKSPIATFTEKVAALLKERNCLETVYVTDVVIDLLKKVRKELGY